MDAAWDGPLLFSEKYRHRLTGIGQADSVTIDGRKQLYLPVGTGTILLRDPKLARVIEKQTRYVVREGSPDLGRRSLEGTRPAMSLYLHAALNLICRRGYAFLIDSSIQRAQYLAERI